MFASALPLAARAIVKQESLCSPLARVVRKSQEVPGSIPTSSHIAANCRRNAQPEMRIERLGPAHLMTAGKPFCFRFWECSTGFQPVYFGLGHLLEAPEPFFLSFPFLFSFFPVFSFYVFRFLFYFHCYVRISFVHWTN